MDLKSFHVFFIFVAALALFGMSVWAFNFAHSHAGQLQNFAWINLIGGVLVALYGVWFVRKSAASR